MRAAELTERATAQSLFIKLCQVLSELARTTLIPKASGTPSGMAR